MVGREPEGSSVASTKVAADIFCVRLAMTESNPAKFSTLFLVDEVVFIDPSV